VIVSERPSIVYAGTPEFARVVLEGLVQRGENLVGIITQPDRPAGRGRKLQASPVKERAQQLALPILQPESCRDPHTLRWLQDLHPDLLIVVAFGQLLPQSILDTPRLGAINVHASLLPAWRGAAPIVRALAAGDTETGISIMQMEAGLDSGPVLWTRKTPILPDDTGQSLHDRLAILGAEALGEALERLWQGTIEAIPQDHGRATYAKKLCKEEARLSWQEDANTIARKIRAFVPYPVAHAQFRGQGLRIWAAQALAQSATTVPGQVQELSAQGPIIACGQGCLLLTEVQPAGKGRISGTEFLHGYRLEVGEVLT